MRLSSLIFAVTLLGYWGRVMRLAVKAKRRTGRAGNLVPGDAAGRAVRPIWAAAVLVWIANPLVVGLSHRVPVALAPVVAVPPPVRWAAVGVVATAAWATTICWRRMGKSWRMGILPGEQTALVTAGPYARVRHPIYALSIVMMLATAVAVPSPAVLAAAAVHLTLVTWEAAREERHLLAVHGDAYRAYGAATGRFVPRLDGRKFVTGGDRV